MSKSSIFGHIILVFLFSLYLVAQDLHLLLFLPISILQSIHLTSPDVCDKHLNQVIAYKMDKTGVLGFFMAIIMKEQRGAANPGFVKDALIKELNSR